MPAFDSEPTTHNEFGMNHARCRYPSKRCDNLRVVKRDGALHRFCEYHRVKANMNQQRLEQRRRMAKQLGTSSAYQFQTTIPPFLLMDPQLAYAHGMTNYLLLDPMLQVIDVDLGGLEQVPPQSADLSDMDIAFLMEALAEDANYDVAAATQDGFPTPIDDAILADVGMSICL